MTGAWTRSGAQVAKVAAGLYHSAAVTEGGALFTWGKGEEDSDDAGSQVPGGLGHADLRSHTPSEFKFVFKVTEPGKGQRPKCKIYRTIGFVCTRNL